jgi:hypothetical protein
LTIDIAATLVQHATGMMWKCRTETMMRDPKPKTGPSVVPLTPRTVPVPPPAPEPWPRATRPPTPEDFIKDLDKVDILRRFRF